MTFIGYKRVKFLSLIKLRPELLGFAANAAAEFCVHSACQMNLQYCYWSIRAVTNLVHAMHTMRYGIQYWSGLLCIAIYRMRDLKSHACSHVHTVRRLHVAVLPIPPHQVAQGRMTYGRQINANTPTLV